MCFCGTKPEPTSTVGAFQRVETEKRGCELSINTFKHFLLLATLGITLILDARMYVSDIEAQASAITLYLTPPYYPENWD